MSDYSRESRNSTVFSWWLSVSEYFEEVIDETHYQIQAPQTGTFVILN